MMNGPSDAEFRTVGYTGAARHFPLSRAACAVVAELNGVGIATLPLAFQYAPNAYMCEWMEWLGAEKAEGRPIKSGDRVRTKTI